MEARLCYPSLPTLASIHGNNAKTLDCLLQKPFVVPSFGVTIGDILIPYCHTLGSSSFVIFLSIIISTLMYLKCDIFGGDNREVRMYYILNSI